MSHHSMNRLAAARPAELDAEPDATRRRRDLHNSMSQPFQTRATARSRPNRRVTITVGVAGTLATAAAAAAVVTAGGPAGHARVPNAAPVALDARTVLLAAADHAYRQPSGSGAYWHRVTVERSYLRVGTGATGYTLVTQDRGETWTPSATGTAQWSRDQSLGAVPATRADQAAWQRAGAPTSIPVRIPIAPGSRITKPLTVSTKPGKATTNHAPLVDGDKVAWLGRNVTMKQIRALPDTPEGLRSWLLRSYTGHDTETPGQPMTSDAWLFRVAGSLVTQVPAPATVRTAAFHLLAGLPSVTAAGRVTDAQGRTGVAITSSSPGSPTQDRLIVDPATGQALVEETIVVHPSGGLAGYPAGSPLSSSTVISESWTNAAPTTR